MLIHTHTHTHTHTHRQEFEELHILGEGGFGAGMYSVYLLYWYKYTNPDAAGETVLVPQSARRAVLCAKIRDQESEVYLRY